MLPAVGVDGAAGAAEVGGQVRWRRRRLTGETSSERGVHACTLHAQSGRVVDGLHEFTEQRHDAPVEPCRALDVRALPLLANHVGDRVT